jgi:glycerol-3-phosphate acyltransferase PlsY
VVDVVLVLYPGPCGGVDVAVTIGVVVGVGVEVGVIVGVTMLMVLLGMAILTLSSPSTAPNRFVVPRS